jgi:hypothetical protein
MPSWNVGDVAIHICGAELTLRDVVSIPAPKPFREGGIRGILSPHQLDPSAFTVLDLVADELILLQATDKEMADYLTARSPTLRFLTLARVGEFPSVVVRAAVDGFDEIPVLVDTGGKRTEFAASVVPGLAVGQAQRLGGGVGDSDYAGSNAGPQTLLVDGHRLNLPALAVRTEMHDPQGIVGMDVLRGTILAATAEVSRPVFWLVP